MPRVSEVVKSIASEKLTSRTCGEINCAKYIVGAVDPPEPMPPKVTVVESMVFGVGVALS